MITYLSRNARTLCADENNIIFISAIAKDIKVEDWNGKCWNSSYFVNCSDYKARWDGETIVVFLVIVILRNSSKDWLEIVDVILFGEIVILKSI